jgi:hypothetical protein
MEASDWSSDVCSSDLYTNAFTLGRGPTSVIYVTMILYARLFLQSMRKLTRSAATNHEDIRELITLLTQQQ